jgi:glycine/D-amino acid oxidase-like deaminating enzyme
MGVAAAIARRARSILPALADLRVLRAWAALRVMTPDGLPIYAQSAAFPGAFLVACHSGVTLAAAHARLLAPALRDGAIPSDLGAFDATRFADVRAAA